MSSLLMPTYWHQLKICWQYCLRKQITHICSERLKACINCWQIYRIFAFIKYFLFQEMVETSVQTFHLNGNLTLLENDVHKKTGRYKPWLHSTYCSPISCWSTLLSLCLGDGCLLNLKISGDVYQIVSIVVQCKTIAIITQ